MQKANYIILKIVLTLQTSWKGLNKIRNGILTYNHFSEFPFPLLYKTFSIINIMYTKRDLENKPKLTVDQE